MATGTTSLKRLSSTSEPVQYSARSKKERFTSRSATNEESSLNFEKNEKMQDDLGLEQQDYAEIICRCLFGLNMTSVFLDEINSIPDNVRCHRSTKNWVITFIENRYNEMKEESVKQNLDEDLLKQLGFNTPKVMEKVISRSKLMQQHLDPIDSVKRFLRDEFKYNSILPGFMQENEARTLADSTADVLYFSEYSNEQSEQFVRLFHGTDIFSAANILQYGIEVGFGMPKRDFSDGLGFYLTDSFEHAKTWALSQTSEPVVLEFKVQEDCLKEAKSPDLSREERGLTWYEIVKEHRSGKPSRRLRERLRGYDCITGPISVPRCSGSEILREPKPDSYQMCVVNEDFADEIGKHAKYILYKKPPKKRFSSYEMGNKQGEP